MGEIQAQARLKGDIGKLADEVLGGPFPEAILLMEGDQGSKVWVNEARTVARIEFSDGLVAHGLMTVVKEADNVSG